MKQATRQQQMLQTALQFHGSGNLGEAEKIYRSLLEEDPHHPDALHYLGVVGLQVRRFDEAVDLIQRAIDARPDYVDAIVNLGNALQSLDRFEKAIEQFERALALAPPSAPLLANLGGALAQLGRYPEAVKRFAAALELQPELAETRRSLADALLETGLLNEALRQIAKAMTDGPVSIAMQVSRGNIYRALGRGSDAIRCFTDILDTYPEALGVRTSLADVFRQTGRISDAIELYEKVLEQDPKHVDCHYKMGGAYEELGNREKALQSFRRAVQIDARCTKAWHAICGVSNKAFDDKEVSMLQGMAQDSETLPEDRMRLAFALGRHFEKSGQHDDAAEQYLLANSLRRVAFDYNIDNDIQAFGNIRSRFDMEFLNRWQDAGLPDASPIFIIGMPRSGTTLVEQILASHPRVFGAGELPLLSRCIIDTFQMPDGVDYTGALDTASVNKFQTIANSYLAGLPDVGADYVTDKLPHNFLNVGMIRILFPNASIVHCRRDPRDTCFSIYKHLFGAHGHNYAYDLEELGKTYKEYARLMAHWEEVLPGALHTVQYETMIDRQEQTTRELLEACNLEWDPACLEFHKLDRPVATISASQVRQPMSRGSIGAWRPYEKMLHPLLEILDGD